MSDLISRQAAVKVVEDLPNCYNGYSDTYDKACIIGLLEELPSAQERKKGKWVAYIGRDLGIEGQWMRDDGKTVFVQCDQCGELYVRNFMANWNYCPNCGAEMRGEEE